MTKEHDGIAVEGKPVSFASLGTAVFVITLDGDAIGHFETDTNLFGMTSVAVWIAPGFRGQGYATRAAKIFITMHTEKQVSLMYAIIRPTNEASCRLAERFGATYRDVDGGANRRYRIES